MQTNALTTYSQNNTAITPVERSVIEQLPAGLKKYVLAKDCPRIIDLTPIEATGSILNLVNQTQINIGHTKLAEDDVINAQLTSGIYELIKDRYQSLTFQELKLAFLNHFIDSGDTNITLNLKSAASAIKNYSTSELKKKAMTEWNNLIYLVQERKLTPEQKEAIMIDGCVSAFDEYKANPLALTIIANRFYDYLKDKGLINLPKDVKEKIHVHQKEIYEAELKQEKIKRTISKSSFEHIMENLNQNTTLINRCKRAALKHHFDEIISIGGHIKDYLK